MLPWAAAQTNTYHRSCVVHFGLCSIILNVLRHITKLAFFTCFQDALYNCNRYFQSRPHGDECSPRVFNWSFYALHLYRKNIILRRLYRCDQIALYIMREFKPPAHLTIFYAMQNPRRPIAFVHATCWLYFLFGEWPTSTLSEISPPTI